MPYGTLGADVVQSSTAGTAPTFKDGNGTETGTLCRAWVSFNGTGTVAINASFNISSITDNGTGNYTLNFTTALPDANYAMSGSTLPTTGSDRLMVVSEATSGLTPVKTTTQLKVITGGSGASTSSGYVSDCPGVSVAIFR